MCIKFWYVSHFVFHKIVRAQRSANLHPILPQSRIDTSTIAGDESWAYEYDPETDVHSSASIAKGEKRPKKSRHSQSQVKVMLTIFFNQKGVVHHEYTPQRQTINKERYRETLRRLRDAVRRKCPELWASTTELSKSFFTYPDSSSLLAQKSKTSADRILMLCICFS